MNNLMSFYCEDQGFHPELRPASLTQLFALLCSESTGQKIHLPLNALQMF